MQLWSNAWFTHVMHACMQRADSDGDDAGYATPNVVTRSTVHTPDLEQVDMPSKASKDPDLLVMFTSMVCLCFQRTYDNKGYAIPRDTLVINSAASLAPEPEPVKVSTPENSG